LSCLRITGILWLGFALCSFKVSHVSAATAEKHERNDKIK